MAKRKIKTKVVPATSSNIVAGICAFLNNRGHFAFPVGSRGVWDPVKQVFRTSGGTKGTSDIIVCFRYRQRLTGSGSITFFDCGLFGAIEVKNELTRDRMRKAQEKFTEKVAAAGGLALVVPSYEAFLNWYSKQKFDEQLTTLPG
jgi:hypothetical protein